MANPTLFLSLTLNPNPNPNPKPNPEPTQAALLNLLEGAARSCRYAHAYAAEAAQVQPALQAQLSGDAGEALLRAAVLGLADSLPPAAVPGLGALPGPGAPSP